jgi:hypothetical protein
MRNPKPAVVALLAGVVAATVGLAAPVEAHTTGIHDNCTKLNNKWPHGVGTRKAVDKTSGTRVTSFHRNNTAYWAAERHNGTLDRDNDRIACEKA